MSPEVSDLLKRAMALPVGERAALANTLLDSLEAADQSVEKAWNEEVERRMKDLEAGKGCRGICMKQESASGFVPREIPRPAAENAALRDDAVARSIVTPVIDPLPCNML